MMFWDFPDKYGVVAIFSWPKHLASAALDYYFAGFSNEVALATAWLVAVLLAAPSNAAAGSADLAGSVSDASRMTGCLSIETRLGQALFSE